MTRLAAGLLYTWSQISIPPVCSHCDKRHNNLFFVAGISWAAG